jgi:iron complex outermembrane receptor protein
MMMRYTLISFFLLSPLLIAQDVDSNFLESLDEVSEIATKAKLNIDDAPSFVTVLQSEKLQNLGIKNVFEALALVPGVELKKELSGVPVIVFRGATQKGEVKFMIDGIGINNTYRGSIYYYLDFPIELIDRIEVIRGAGSILYGSNAISGVINIITKNSEEIVNNNIFLGSGTYNHRKIGTMMSSRIDEIKFSVDAYKQSNTKTVFVEPNITGRSGVSDRHLDDYSVGLNVLSEHFSFNARIKKSEIGNAYGLFSVLDTNLDRFSNENRAFFSELTYKNDLNAKNSIKYMVGYTNYQQKLEVAHPQGFIITTDYEERSYFSELNILSKSIENNRLLIGARVETTKELKNGWFVNEQASDNPIIKGDFSRKIASLYFNDEYALTKKLDVSTGIRYDHYSDFKGSISPNLGLVYKMTSKLRLKALYAHSFRAPSLIELTSNKDLKAEKSDSLEAGIVYKHSAQHSVKLNIYETKIDDLITRDSVTHKYMQKTKNTFCGVEFDYVYIPTNSLEIDFLASYIDVRDDDNNKLRDVANILSSTTLSYELDSGFTFGTIARFVSHPNRFHSFILDQTVSYNYKDLTASLVVHDLFDKNVYYLTAPNAYQQDFDDGGRTVMFNVSLEF